MHLIVFRAVLYVQYICFMYCFEIAVIITSGMMVQSTHSYHVVNIAWVGGPVIINRVNWTTLLLNFMCYMQVYPAH